MCFTVAARAQFAAAVLPQEMNATIAVSWVCDDVGAHIRAYSVTIEGELSAENGRFGL